jgi:hypothetical protein
VKSKQKEVREGHMDAPISPDTSDRYEREIPDVWLGEGGKLGSKKEEVA